MGIAELEPRQLAPTVGTTGSGSTVSPALSSSSTTLPAFSPISIDYWSSNLRDQFTVLVASRPPPWAIRSSVIKIASDNSQDSINISYVRNPRRDPISGAVVRATQLSRVPRILISAKDQAGITAR
jgi:hypothetical protein